MHPTPTTITTGVLDHLRAVNHTRNHATTERRRLISAALAAGHTWTEIAHALDDSELGAVLDHLAATAAEQGSEGR